MRSSSDRPRVDASLLNLVLSSNRMRAFFILIVLVILMNAVKCPGCSQSFDRGVSTKTHQRKCTALLLAGQKRIKKRVENAQKREAAKLARLEGHTLDEIAEERQELRDQLGDESPQPDIPPQEGEAAESSTVRNNALEIYLRLTIFIDTCWTASSAHNSDLRSASENYSPSQTIP